MKHRFFSFPTGLGVKPYPEGKEAENEDRKITVKEDSHILCSRKINFTDLYL